ncbi:MAG: Ref family recombination enhancement nuclease [Sideroxyarcus sp.]|nr:Ref family recombination enhancement nuclease [Sideroxyarcus sp.]
MVAMTKAEKERDALIRQLGCIACYVQTGQRGTHACSHHITVGGRRKGHTYTIPLCNPGHHKDVQAGSGKEPFHHNKKAFEAQYGPQEELFALTNKLIGYTDERIAAMVAERDVAAKPVTTRVKTGRSDPVVRLKQKVLQSEIKARFIEQNAEKIDAFKVKAKARAKERADDLRCKKAGGWEHSFIEKDGASCRVALLRICHI